MSSVRPERVSRAAHCFVGAFFVGMVTLATDKESITLVENPLATNILLTIVFCVTFFLISKFYNRKNWARITYLVMSIIGAPFYLQVVYDQFISTALVGSLFLIQSLLTIYGNVLLFTGSSNEWFRRQRVSSEKVNLG